MLEQPPNIPQVVVNYGDFRKNYIFGYYKDWNGYQIYSIFPKESYKGIRYTGFSPFFLYDGEKVRRATSEEIDQFRTKGPIKLYSEPPRLYNKD